jgi:hypothetical protein
MGVSKKVFGYKTTKEKLYHVYLSSINGILNLTGKELLITAKFYTYLDEISKGVTDKKIQNELLFSSTYKKRIREELEMSALLMNNYISSLKEKKIIKEVDGVKYINPALQIDSDNKSVEVTFKFVVE